MSKSVVITARVEEPVAKELDRLAADWDRSRAWLVTKAVERFVAEETALIDAIRAGEADFAAGRIVSQADVEQRFGIDRSKRHAA